jgi:membrane-bound lytic murein transglycosylase D
MGQPAGRPPTDRAKDQPARLTGLTAVAGLHLGTLTPSELDSLYGDAERLLDSLAVPVSPFYTEGPPDISDSLAAATQAQLPSVDELFDYDVVVNPRVLAWIDFYEVRAHDFFDRSLQRSGRYLAMARRIFAEEGIPQDLAFLPHVESGFRHNARSRVRAVGLWQFMRGTAKLYGLRCDGYVDERLDPEKSTRAAARLLRDLYALYEDWNLALAAYNAGAGCVNRAIERAGSRDFWEIARSRKLVRETRDFVPSMMAATILAKSPGAYGFTEDIDPPLEYDKIAVDSPTDLRILARCSGVSVETIQDLNPALLGSQTPPTRRFEVHIPKGTAEQFAREFAKIPAEKRLASGQHTVKKGETLGALAQRYGTSVKAIQDANHLGRSTLIRVGQSLRIPGRGGDEALAPALASANGPAASRSAATRHTVGRGECLAGIARQYGLRVEDLQAANGISDPSRIAAGQVLTLPAHPSATEPAPQMAAVEPAPASAAQPAAAKKAFAGDARGGASAAGDPAAHANPAGNPPAHTNAPGDPQAHAAKAGAAPETIAPQPAGLALEPVSSPADLASDLAADLAAGLAGGENGLRAQNTSDALGRVPTTRHIVEQAREQMKREQESAAAAVIEPGKHRVGAGETLSDIARRYDVKVADLRRWNELGRNDTIEPGDELLVNGPPAVAAKSSKSSKSTKGGKDLSSAKTRVHVVRQGETLWKIAKRYGVQVSDLISLNNLGRAALIYPGQKLRIY